MKEDFKYLLQDYDSKALTHKNILNREKGEALQVNQYKELYKMEKIKREEEENDLEKEWEMRREEEKQLEKQERIRQEELRIKTEKIIE